MEHQKKTRLQLVELARGRKIKPRVFAMPAMGSSVTYSVHVATNQYRVAISKGKDENKKDIWQCSRPPCQK